ncbi:MAG TPA: hypothetical protein VIV06_09520, partial [Candidatus Limnocylindrales bacterium]
AVQRVLKSPGSLVDLSQVSQISIYEVGTNGTISGNKNIWQRRVQADGSPNPANPAVPCQAPVQLLDFYEVSSGWPAAGRDNGPAPDSIGVGISYVYRFQTPLSGILRFLGGAGWTQVQVSDRTVMALEPTE